MTNSRDNGTSRGFPVIMWRHGRPLKMVLHVRFLLKLDLKMACIKASKKGKKKGKRHTKACKNGLHKEQAHKTIHRQQNKIIDKQTPHKNQCKMICCRRLNWPRLQLIRKYKCRYVVEKWLDVYKEVNQLITH